MLKIISFLKKNYKNVRQRFIILEKVELLLYIVIYRIWKFFTRKPIVYDTNSTIEKILEENCSLARYGDGEFGLIYNKSIDFQPYHEELGQRLKAILKNESKGLLIGIPDVFNSLKQYVPKTQQFWLKHLARNGYKWNKLLNKKSIYYNSFITRPYIIYKDKNYSQKVFDKVKLIWHQRNVILVEGEKSRLGVGNDLFDNVNSIKRIICPNFDAYSRYDEILKTVLDQGKDNLILISLGPTATVLAYDLHQKGYQAIDIGHIDIEYEWFLRNVSEKVKIKGKYVGEVDGGQDVNEIKDLSYLNQIIKRIS